MRAFAVARTGFASLRLMTCTDVGGRPALTKAASTDSSVEVNGRPVTQTLFAQTCLPLVSYSSWM
jgi:hypothetical protein